MPQARQSAAAEDWSWRSNAYAWWIVIVLALSLTLSLVDRMILALMIEPIKRDLGLSDTAVSLVHGLAFTILYVIVGLPMGRIADIWNRRALAACSVLGWSIMTGLCGFAGNFTQLFAARMGVGVGEAGLSPAAVSLVSDYFPKEERAKPLAFLTIGTTAGAGLALMFGGALIRAIGDAGKVALPLLGTVYSWQAIFISLGVFGVLFSGIFATLKEPARRGELDANPPRISAVLIHIRRNAGFFLNQFLGPAFAVLVLIAFHSWAPTFLIRRFGWNASQAGLIYGLVLAGAGLVGILLSGVAADWLSRKGRRDATLVISAIAATAAIAPLALSPLAPTPFIALCGLFIGIMFLTVVSALAPATLQSACPNQMRGQVFAIYLFILSLLGYAVGPIIVAVATDSIFRNEANLHYSLALTAAVFTPLSALCMYLSRLYYVRSSEATH